MVNVRNASLLSLAFLILTFVSQVLITRSITNNLGLEMYGVWAIIMSIQSYLFIADSGLSSSVTTYANIFETRGQGHKVRPLLATNIYLLTVIFAIIFVAGFLIGWLSDSRDINWQFMITVATANVYILSISGVFSNLLIAYFQVDISKLFQIVNVVIMTSLVLFFSENGASIEGVVGALLISSAIYLFIIIVYAIKRYSKITRDGLFFLDVDIVKEVYKFSINTFVIALAGRIQFYTDVLIIGLFLGLVQTGIYEINNKLPFYATFLASSFVVLYYPIMTKLHTMKDVDGLRKLYFSVQFFSVFFGVAASVVLYLYIDELLSYWLGSNAVHVEKVVFFLMLISLIFHAILGPVATLFQAIGRNSMLMYAEVLMAFVNISLSIYLIDSYALFGVILGTVIAQFSFFLFVYPYMLKTVLRVRFNLLFREAIFPLLVSVSIVSFSLYLYTDFIKGFEGILAIIISSAMITGLIAVVFLAVDFIAYKTNLKKYLAINMVLNTRQYAKSDRTLYSNDS